MKYLLKLFLLLSVLSLINSCKEDNDTVVGGFKGYIYYSTGGEIYRVNMKSEISEKLFTNAHYPDITATGEILVQESYPLARLILTDLTGANRKSVLDGTDYNGPIHRRYMDHPRISKNQKYIAYDGGSVYNPVTYVIDVNTGELVATIGDYSERQPLYQPSWAPDGSIYVMGWTSMNNGIYKVSPDFTTVSRVDPNLSNVAYPSVSPDGQSIAFIRDGQLWLMGIDGSNPTQLYVGTETFYIPTWSPDSKYIAVVSKWDLYIFDITKNTYSEISKAGYISIDGQMSWVY